MIMPPDVAVTGLTEPGLRLIAAEVGDPAAGAVLLGPQVERGELRRPRHLAPRRPVRRRVAGLFVTKTVYAALIAVAAGTAGITYPFFPRHLTIVSTLTIGAPLARTRAAGQVT